MALVFSPLSFERDRELCRQAEASAYCDIHRVDEVDTSEVDKALFRIQGLLNGSRYWGFTAEEDGKPVGLIFVDTDFPDAQAFIDNIYVAPEHRRRDIGSRLVQYAMDFLKERGIRQVDLMVTAENEPAIQLYKSIGYEVTRLRMNMRLDG
jgi:ribosomal protein S18 acetylase RimI-like enzyme